MKRYLLVLCITVFVLITSGRSHAATIYLDNMNAGPSAWTATGYWHQTGACFALGYWGYWDSGNCFSYDNGTANSGTLTSPVIAIPANSTAQLIFQHAWCGDTSASRDQRFVQISENGGPFVTMEQLVGESWCSWLNKSMNISSYAGSNIQVRFLFDTVDNVNNTYLGWVFNYVQVDATAIAPVVVPGYSSGFVTTTDNWIDISGTGTSIFAGDTDDNGVVVPIGFNFTHFGNTYSTIGVSSNGYLTFGPDLSDYSNDDIPNATDPNDFIAPFWDDLYIYPNKPGGGGNVFYQTIGDAPNRKFIVQYNNVDFYSGQDNGKLYFEVILYEAYQKIEFQYRDMTSVNAARGSGNSATIGMENSAGTIGQRFSYNTNGAISNGALVSFAQGDSDGDGLSDFFEYTYGTDPYDPDNPNLIADADGDGLGWLQEFSAGTNPILADTDDDGANDGAEVAAGTNPLVANGSQATLVTSAGPGVQVGTAFLNFTVSNIEPHTAGFRVYYGPASGTTANDYAAHFDITNTTAREGYIDQQWGMQGIPMVYFRIAPYREINGAKFIGTLSNELSVYFKDSEPTKDTGGTGNAGTITASTTSNDKFDGRCFIATAAYGSQNSEPVTWLRKFRDAYLLTNAAGRWFVDAYYRTSPPIAAFVSEHEWAKFAVRGALAPAVGMSYLLVEASPATRLAGFMILMGLTISLFVLVKRRRTRA